MKQIIEKNSDGSIDIKYYENDKGQYHGLSLWYYSTNTVFTKINYINGQKYGLQTYYGANDKINEQKYFL